MKYKIIVDNGKPYELLILNKKILFKELLRLNEEEEEKEDNPYFEIYIFNSKDEDVTEEILAQYRLKKREEKSEQSKAVNFWDFTHGTRGLK